MSLLRRARRRLLGRQPQVSLELGVAPDGSSSGVERLDGGELAWLVVSPGRSGTRWLADLLLATSGHTVVHATHPTLAEPGFAFDRGALDPETAWFEYLNSRQPLMEASQALHRTLVDLDCKTTPLVPVVMDRSARHRCLVMLRDPEEFVRSGLMRGYFKNKIPFHWGHLAPVEYPFSFARNPKITPEEQIKRISWFWNRTARIAQEVHCRWPHRTTVLEVARMFSDRTYTERILSEAGLSCDADLLRQTPAYSLKRNSAKGGVSITLLDEARSWIVAEASQGLREEFLEMAGLRHLGA